MNLGNRYNQHSFAKVPSANIPRSKFDRSFAVKDTFNFDDLVPFFVDEILPGDTINLSVDAFIRLAPQVRPLMDNMYIDYFFFFVPNRLVWDNWEKFNGAQDNPGDSTDFLIPQTVAPPGSFQFGSIYDHMGIPAGQPYGPVNALPFRAYNLIWNEWFRDQNLQNSLPVRKNDGPDPLDYGLVKRAKKHDYFTSALTAPQKGPAIYMPGNSGTVPVHREEAASGWRAYIADSETLAGINPITIASSPGVVTNATSQISFDPAGGLVVYPDAMMGTINQLREAFQMQSLLELDMRGGTRYTEILKSHFNVISPDFRLQRPEFLSSTSTKINQHPVTQMSETGTTPQGNLAAYSTASAGGSRVGFSKSFVEHGYVLGLMQARADVTYQNGLHRMWMRRTRWDFFWPKLQEIGEQTIYKGELFYTGVTNDDMEPWAYQERHAEYRYKPSEIRGQFRSNYAQSLDVWHLAEEFTAVPALNASFIPSSTPIERVLVVPDEDYPHLLADFWFNYKHARPIVTYAVPASLGRF
ncbi:major capsid protein [Apis mellifera associated microvirus 26]|nr:major capsid protein [Apis mellifera associated microvirus 26]